MNKKKKNAFLSSLTEPKMEMIVNPQWRGFDDFFVKEEEEDDIIFARNGHNGHLWEKPMLS